MTNLKIRESIKNILITTMGKRMLGKIYEKHLHRKSKDTLNVNHDRKLVFMHIPKTAGTSIKAIVLPQQRGTTHKISNKLVSQKIWDNYTTFCVVRNPFDKFISSYFYHTSKEYTGVLFRKNKNLHNLNLDEYFSQVYQKKMKAQINYITHPKSKKPIDYILRFENLEHDFNNFCKENNINAKLPHKNKSNRNRDYRQYYSEQLKDKIAKFSQQDLQYFGYKW